MDTAAIDEVVVGRVEPHVYAFTTNTVPNYLKVGDTYRPVEVRLDEWREHFPSLVKEFEETACVSPGVFFRDYSVHAYLDETLRLPRLTPADVPPGVYFSKEFFRGATKDDVAAAINDIRGDFDSAGQRYQYYRAEDKLPTTERFPSAGLWMPRPNQAETVRRFEAALKKGRRNLLMYAVMRFGKSFTSMCCAKRMNGGKGAKLVVVVSAKADVKDEWRRTVESAENFRNDYEFFSARDLVLNPKVVSDHLHKKRKKAVVFLTLQDLQSSKVKRKHQPLLKEVVDLLIVDETHYGARANSYGEILRQTKDAPSRRDREDDRAEDETREAVKAFKTKVTLHLSGTPYRILMDGEFAADDIIAFCSFADIARAQREWGEENRRRPEDEQREDWDNPYYGFPQMVRFAFNPNASTRKRLEALRKGGATYAFSALFETKSISRDEAGGYREFKYEQDVLDLFRVIDGSQPDDELLGFLDYPKIKDGQLCRHVVCVLPYCASCDALAALLAREKSTFRNLGSYEILNVSGHEMPKAFDDVEGVKRAIRDAEKGGRKTLTLTVNRMLTGCTVPEWDTMLYFKDTSSPQEYDQAIFRLQNPFVQRMTSMGKDGAESVVVFDKKPQTLLVDFDPGRLFRMQASKSQFYNVNTDKAGNAKLEQRLREELAFSPVIAANAGKLRRVEPADILSALSRYSRERGVSDEVRDVAIDYAALIASPELLDAVSKETPLKKGKMEFSIEPHCGEKVDLKAREETEKAVQAIIKAKDGTANAAEATAAEKARRVLEGKMRTYYSRLLFFAFLSKDRVQSVEDILRVMGRGENVRIARNVGIEKPVVKAILKCFDRFVLSDLDYKIRNLDTLSFDAGVDPLERATTALRKFDRLGRSEIMTPEKVADDMVAMLPEADLRRMAADGERILDIAGKAGEFAVALYKRFRAIDQAIDVSDMILTIPTSGHAYEFTRKVYEALGLNVANIAARFTSYDLMAVRDKAGGVDYARIKKLLTQDKPFNKITMKDNRLTRNSKTIGIVVGNPPYQDQDGSGGTNDAPIYQYFSNVGKEVSNRYVDMIIKSGWFTGGRENLLGAFRKDMLTSQEISQMTSFCDSGDVFDSAEIKGGICYYLRDSKHSGACDYRLIRDKTEASRTNRNLADFDILIRDPLLAGIVKKVHQMAEHDGLGFVSDFISADTPFGIPTNPLESTKTPFAVEAEKGKGFDTPLYLWEKGKRKIAYVRKSDIKKNTKDIDCPKVFIPGAGGSGNDSSVLGCPEIANAGAVCSQTYLYMRFDTRKQCENFSSYVKTRFVRLLISAVKITQHAQSPVYRFVPMQDFSEAWDDERLYAKYGITAEERAFVESMIKPMA